MNINIAIVRARFETLAITHNEMVSVEYNATTDNETYTLGDYTLVYVSIEPQKSVAYKHNGQVPLNELVCMLNSIMKMVA